MIPMLTFLAGLCVGAFLGVMAVVIAQGPR